MRRKSVWRAVALIVGWICLVALAVGPRVTQVPAERDGLPLVFQDDFDEGLARWEFTDPAAWRIDRQGTEKVLSLFTQSQYAPPFRSPVNMALIRDLWVSDFVFEARLASTTKEYDGRDMCVFFGWQSPAKFYYAHMATKADPHHNSIFLVDDADRASIALTRTERTVWGDGVFHLVRVVRRSESGDIEVFFDDMTTPILTARDRTLTLGRIGVGTFDDTGQFDQVRIWGRRVNPPADAAAGD